MSQGCGDHMVGRVALGHEGAAFVLVNLHQKRWSTIDPKNKWAAAAAFRRLRFSLLLPGMTFLSSLLWTFHTLCWGWRLKRGWGLFGEAQKVFSLLIGQWVVFSLNWCLWDDWWVAQKIRLFRLICLCYEIELCNMGPKVYPKSPKGITWPELKKTP